MTDTNLKNNQTHNVIIITTSNFQYVQVTIISQNQVVVRVVIVKYKASKKLDICGLDFDCKLKTRLAMKKVNISKLKIDIINSFLYKKNLFTLDNSWIIL